MTILRNVLEQLVQTPAFAVVDIWSAEDFAMIVIKVVQSDFTLVSNGAKTIGYEDASVNIRSS